MFGTVRSVESLIDGLLERNVPFLHQPDRFAAKAITTETGNVGKAAAQRAATTRWRVAGAGVEGAMKHYIAICIQEHTGEWRVLFPDVPGCEARVHSLDDIAHAAESELWKHVENGSSAALPPSDDAVERGHAWLAENNVDMSKAIVTMVAVP